MRREQNLLARDAEVRGDDAARPHLLAEGVLDRLRERPPRARERAQRAREDAFELQHRALVEHDRVEVARLEVRMREAPLDRAGREARVVLVTREALLLYGADGDAVDDARVEGSSPTTSR